MKVIISAGGTGGHIYPALAIVNKIKEKEPNSQFLYIGTHNRMEKDIVPQYGIPFESIEIYGFFRKKPWKNMETIRCFWKSCQRCKKLIQEFKPDVVVGVGGYVTGPVIYEAHKLGYPTFIHEQNSVAGKANLFLSRYVDQIGVSFPSTVKQFSKEKVTYTGNPCSEDALKKSAMERKELGLSDTLPLVLIVMGSLGSSKVNEILGKTMSLFRGKPYQILFVTGKDGFDKLAGEKFPSNVKAVPYVENMTRLMKKTDLMVSRAGASTLSEIMALEVPSILIPSPYVTNNHQYKNAMDLVNQDAALLLEEKDLGGDNLVRLIDQTLADQSHLVAMKQHLRRMSIPNSATKIYEILKEMSEK